MGSASGWGISEEIVVNENERRRREAAKAHAQQKQAKRDLLKKLGLEPASDDATDHIYETVLGRYIGTTDSGSSNGVAGRPGRTWQVKQPQPWSPSLTGEDTTKLFRDAIENMKRLGITSVDAERHLSRMTGLIKENGHKSKCQYREGEGVSDWACTCQPPTLWGRVFLWYCECCEKPEAPMSFGLCDLCRSHEYAPMEQVRIDHEVALDA